MKNHVEFKSNKLILRGYLHLPNTKKEKFPLVCMFHGFTGNKMEDHFCFVRLSNKLEELGIASLRMDFGNSGESDGKFEDMTPIGEIEDGINIIKYAKSIPRINLDEIGLIGFSMGGMIAGIVASEFKNDIKSLCLISPAANMEEIMSEYFQDNNVVADINGLLFSKVVYEEMKTINPYERSMGYHGEVLIIHGAKDQAVPTSIVRKYKEIYGSNIKFIDIEGGNHVLNSRKWENELSEEINAFFKANLLGGDE